MKCHEGECDLCDAKETVYRDLFGFLYCQTCWEAEAPKCWACCRVLPKPDCCELAPKSNNGRNE